MRRSLRPVSLNDGISKFLDQRVLDERWIRLDGGGDPRIHFQEFLCVLPGC